jgi:hypothetical protein
MSREVRIGSTAVPAGSYTLWMLLARNGTAQLIVNKQTNVFGTNYDPAHDLARIPLMREALDSSTERFTIELQRGSLRAIWGDVAWSVPIVVSTPQP